MQNDLSVSQKDTPNPESINIHLNSPKVRGPNPIYFVSFRFILFRFIQSETTATTKSFNETEWKATEMKRNENEL